MKLGLDLLLMRRLPMGRRLIFDRNAASDKRIPFPLRLSLALRSEEPDTTIGPPRPRRRARRGFLPLFRLRVPRRATLFLGRAFLLGRLLLGAKALRDAILEFPLRLAERSVRSSNLLSAKLLKLFPI